MASSSFGGTVKLTGESEYRKALKEINSSLKLVSSELKLTATQFANNDKSLKSTKSSYTSMNSAVKEQREKVASLRTTLKQMEQEYGSSNEKVKQFKTQLNNAEKKLIDMENATDKSTDELKDFKKAEDDAGGSTVKLGDLIKAHIISEAIISGIKALGSAMKSMVSGIISTGSEFEASMSKVSAISGATGEDFQKLKDKASEMGATTKFTATESAEALQYMAMAGWKTNDMVDGLDGIMNLAAASGEELATTSDIVTDALTAFGLQANQSSHFADILASASSNSNTNVSMMGETFQYAASIAGSLGYSAEDTAVAIGLMANAGIKASQAGTSLRSIMSRIATNTGGARDAMEELGITVVNSDGSMRDFGDVMVDLREKFQGLTAEEQANYSKTIAGQQALSGFLAIANSGDADFVKLTNAIENCDGAAANMAETMLDNLEGKKTLFISAAQGLGNAIYDGLQEPLKDVVSLATESVNNLTKAFNENGFSGLVDQIGVELNNWINKILEYLPQILDAGIQIIMKLLEGITQTLPQIMPAIVQIVVTIAQNLINMLPQLIESGIQILLSLIQGITEALPQLIAMLPDIIMQIVNTLLDNLPQIIQAGIELTLTLINGIMDALPQLLDYLPIIIENVVTVLIENLPLLLGVGIQLILSLIGGLIKALPQLISFVPKISLAITKGLIQGLPKFLDNGGQMIANIITGIGNNLGLLASKAGEIKDKIISKIKGIPSEMKTWGKDMIQGLIDGITGMIGKIGDAVKGVADKIKNFLHFSKPDEGPLREYEEWMPDMVTGLSDSLKKASPKLINQTKALANGMADAITNVPQSISTNSNLNPINKVENNTFNIYSPKDSPSEYARRIRQELQYQKMTG